MADVKISALPAAGAITGAEIVPIVQGGVTKRTTTAGLLLQNNGVIVTAAALITDVEATTVNASGSMQSPIINLINPSLATTLTLDGATSKMTMVSATDGATNASLTASGNAGAGAAQGTWSGSLQVGLKFAANGSTPQAKAAVNVAAIDPATTMALVNQLRAALIANGICV